MVTHIFKNQEKKAGLDGKPYPVFPSKLSPVHTSTKHIQRTRLLSSLDAGLSGKLTLICAPVGFGKSVLLSQWYTSLHGKDCLAIWISVDAADRDPMRFFAHVYAGFSNREKRLISETDSVSTSYHVESGESLLQNIYNSIRGVGLQCILLLDGYEQAASPEFNQAICSLLQLMPANFHLAVTSRVAPIGLTARFWLDNRTSRFDAKSLCFTQKELLDMVGTEKESALIKSIYRRTKGWPYVTRLIIDEDKRKRKQEKANRSPSAKTVQLVHEYVIEQLLHGLSTETQQTLIKTSFLEEINPVLADRICQQENSSAIFEGLNHLYPLVAKNDHGDYTINALLRDCLSLSFKLLTITERRHAHTAVVNWYMEQDNLHMALRYAQEAGASQLFANIVEYFGPTSMATQEGVTAVKLAMEKIPIATIRKSSRLIIAQAYILIKDGQFSIAVKKLEDAQLMLVDKTEQVENGHGSAMTDYISTQYLLALYNNENFNREYLDQCEIEIFQHPRLDGAIGFIHALKSLLHQRRSAFSRAFAEADRSLGYYKTAKSNYGIASVHLIIGLCYFAKGQLDLAMRSYVRGQKIIHRDFADDPGLNAIAETLVAEVNYERNKCDKQSNQLESAIEALESHDGWLDTFLAAYRVATDQALKQNDIETAHMILDRATLLASERSLAEIKRFADLIRINVHIKSMELQLANEGYRQYEIENGKLEDILERKPIWRELDDYYFTTARLMIADGKGNQALQTLEPIVNNAHETGRLLSATTGQVLQALANLSLGQLDEAITVLKLAVTVGCSEKYLRVFLDEGEGITPILQHIVDHERRGTTRTKLGNYCSRLMSAYRKEQGGNKTAISLTPRERQILIGLSHENPSKIIARDLFVTESTIKFHLKKIYSKLGVSKRSTAVIEARRHKLL